jgi:hypothetical protein
MTLRRAGTGVRPGPRWLPSWEVQWPKKVQSLYALGQRDYLESMISRSH